MTYYIAHGIIFVIIWSLWSLMFMLVIRYFLRRDIRNRIIAFESPHETRRAVPAEFPGLNTQRYDEIQAELEAAGYRHSGDVEDMTLTRTQMNPHAPTRLMLSADGTVCAGILQLRFSLTARIIMRRITGSNPFIVALQMRFTDGSVLIAQRSTPNLVDIEPPEIIYATMPQNSTIAELLEKLRTMRDQMPEKIPVPMRSLDDALALDNHLTKLRREYRLKVGLYTVEDLLRQKSKPKMARELVAKMDKLLKNDPVWSPSLRPARQEEDVA